jgi:S1-C subfamily serine protease
VSPKFDLENKKMSLIEGHFSSLIFVRILLFYCAFGCATLSTSMNINDLNNHQMVLLTMFVAFVVAIGTGIITASLLQSGPLTVTQTVNRVVERTIERVVTGTTTPEKPAPAPIQTVTKEVTVYAKEDDLVVSAVEKNQPRVTQILPANAGTSTLPIGIGFIISRDGIVVADSDTLTGETGLKAEYVVLINGKTYVAKLQKPEGFEKQPISFLKLALPSGATLDAVSWSSKIDPKVAQTAVVLGGADGTNVFKATLSRMRYEKSEGTSTPSILTSIETTPKIPEGNAGALVVNLDGQALGIVIWNEADTRYLVYPASRILNLVNAIMSMGDASTKQAEGDPKGGGGGETVHPKDQLKTELGATGAAL